MGAIPCLKCSPQYRTAVNSRLWGCGFTCTYPILCLLLVLLLVEAGYADTKPSDVQGLLAIKNAIYNHDNDFLMSWTDGTDPCGGEWRGVSCNCTAAQRERPGIDFQCPSIEPGGSVDSRVIGLVLGCKQCRTEDQKLNGTISEDVWKLNELRFLDLSMNNLEGELPAGIKELRELRFLSVSDNQLTGSLPDFFGELIHLKQLQIDSNNFSGAIPEAWCTPGFNITKVIVHENQGLCGNVPTCLQEGGDVEQHQKVPSVEGTYLRRSTSDERGICDSSPPVCKKDEGCRVVVPKFWTSLHYITFGFTNFFDPESNIGKYFFVVTEKNGDIAVPETEVKGGENSNMRITKEKIRKKEDPSVTSEQISVEFDLAAINLRSGSIYTVTVIAENNAGPPLRSQARSEPVQVDHTGPEGGSLSVDDSSSPPRSPGQVHFQWELFADQESNISSLTIQVVKKNQEGNVENVTAPQKVPTDETTSTVEAVLEPKSIYIAKLRAINNAGIPTVKLSEEFEVVPEEDKDDGISATMMIIVGVVCVAAGFVTMSLLVVAIDRMRKLPMGQDSHEIVKSFMESLLHTGSDQPKHRPEVVEDHQEMAFVVTDLEGSTEMSNYSETGFKTMTVIHDEIMRTGIAAHGGYEINTEGDAFLVAFTSVVDAVLFCMETQYGLLDAIWPKEVLRLPKCRVERTVEGDILFRGPRVRMAIHWDAKIVNKLHPTTRCRVFEGPGFDFTKELADAAHGGQVLLTHSTWQKLLNNMGISGFPTVEQIGEFSVEKWPSLGESSMWLYQITQLVGRPLRRAFPNPRNLELIREGWGFSIVPPPIPNSTKAALAFVAVRMVFPEGVEELPPDMGDFIFEIMASLAQQFKGYIYGAKKEKGRALLAFSRTLDAVRYSHALQVVMLHTDWPDDFDVFSGSTEYGPLGELLFFGPRVAVAVHYTRHYSIHPQGEGLPNQGQWIHYGGSGQSFIKKLSKLVNGGQVVLSEPAWSAIQSRLPGQTQIISLGKHILDPADKHPQLLMEVLPEILKHREFRELETEKKMAPGYRDSPPVSQNIAIVFVKVVKPKDVQDAERQKDTDASVDEHYALQVLTDYITSVGIFSDLVRKWLPEYKGYECKEAESGKLTLAFWDVDDAIRWCAHVQLQLLQQEWPTGLLEMDGCNEVRANTGELLQKGLRVRMGMAYGMAGLKKALSSGQADYFGHVPNLAARVSALAAPGQILLECSPGFDNKVSWIKEGSVGLLTTKDGGPIELKGLGHYYLKGFDDNTKLIYQASPTSLLKRTYEMEPAAIRVADGGRPNLTMRTQCLRRTFKKRRDWFSRFTDKWRSFMNGDLIRIPTGKHLSTSSPKLDGSSTLAGSSQQLLYSPKNRPGSPYGLRQIDLARLRMSSSNALLPSPGPSQTGMEDSSLTSHGSWGESAYHIHPRSGSGVSSVSRGPSSTYQPHGDASSSPPPDASPFSHPSDELVEDEGPGTSLSFRPVQHRERVLSLNDSIKDIAVLQGSDLVARASNGSVGSVQSQRSYIQELAELWVSGRLREKRSGSAFEFRPQTVEPSLQSSPTIQRSSQDIEMQMCRQDSRSSSAPDFLFREWWGHFTDVDSELERAHSLHLSRQHAKLENQALLADSPDAETPRSSTHFDV